MTDPINCILSFVVPCGVVISCAACCISCCCYCARNLQAGNQPQPAEDEVVTSQPRSYATLKRSMVVKFNTLWAAVHKGDNGDGITDGELKLPDKKQLEKVDCKENCIICWEIYKQAEEGDQLVGMVKKCGHYFHFDCLWTWLETHDSCPLCRESTGLSEDDITGIPLKCIVEKLSLVEKVTDIDKSKIENEKEGSITSEEKKASKDSVKEHCSNTSIFAEPTILESNVSPSDQDSTVVVHRQAVARAYSYGGSEANIKPSHSNHDDNEKKDKVNISTQTYTKSTSVMDNPCFVGDDRAMIDHS